MFQIQSFSQACFIQSNKVRFLVSHIHVASLEGSDSLAPPEKFDSRQVIVLVLDLMNVICVCVFIMLF